MNENLTKSILNQSLQFYEKQYNFLSRKINSFQQNENMTYWKIIELSFLILILLENLFIFLLLQILSKLKFSFYTPF